MGCMKILETVLLCTIYLHRVHLYVTINTVLDFSLPRAFVTSSGKQPPVRQTVSKASLPKTSEGKFNMTRCFSKAKHCE